MNQSADFSRPRPGEPFSPAWTSPSGGRGGGLLGPNGAGKTRAIQLLLGLSRPGVGTFRLFGRDLHEAVARVRSGVMLQVSKVPEMLKVREHIHLFAPPPPGFQLRAC